MMSRLASIRSPLASSGRRDAIARCHEGLDGRHQAPLRTGQQIDPCNQAAVRSVITALGTRQEREPRLGTRSCWAPARRRTHPARLGGPGRATPRCASSAWRRRGRAATARREGCLERQRTVDSRAARARRHPGCHATVASPWQCQRYRLSTGDTTARSARIGDTKSRVSAIRATQTPGSAWFRR